MISFRYGGGLLIDRHLEAFIHHPSLPNREESTPQIDTVEGWFNRLEADAANVGNQVPLPTTVEETKRIVYGLRPYLPSDTDVYTLEEGKIAVEIFGATGTGFLLICEPGGSALCIVTVDGISRRARYESSSVDLPDSFLTEGLLDVRRTSQRDFPFVLP